MMPSWKPRTKDIKRYPHLDAPCSRSTLENRCNDSSYVAKHSFWPFIRYEKSYKIYDWKNKTKRQSKIRQITYAAHLDAAIFAKYRAELSAKYETLLKNEDLINSIIAYRKIPVKLGGVHCKSNIEFAKDAFDEIRKLRNCIAIAVDIEKYFDRISHQRLKSIWKDLIGSSTLPADHFAVFKAVTKYRYILREDLYKYLEILTFDATKGHHCYGVSYADLKKNYMKLASNQELREAINKKNIRVHKNEESLGIPQGSPISDVLANVFLLNFDKWANKIADKMGGSYFRYSDDILFILPKLEHTVVDFVKEIERALKDNDENLTLKCKKTNVTFFTSGENRQYAENFFNKKDTLGLNYLGFRFDGKNVYIRNSTISNLQRKICKNLKRVIYENMKRYASFPVYEIKEKFILHEFLKIFGKVEKFREKNNIRDWTFRTYVKRSVRVHGQSANVIYEQIKNMKEFTSRRYSRYFTEISSRILSNENFED